MHMACNAPDAQDDARVLHHAVGVQQPGPHRTDAGAHRMSDEFVQPARLDDLHIVVEQHDDLARGSLYRRIVQGRVVEGAWVAQDADSAVAFNLRQPSQGVGLPGCVVHDEQFPVGIGRPVTQTVHAGLEHGQLVAGGDDDADQRRRRGQGVAHMVGAG